MNHIRIGNTLFILANLAITIALGFAAWAYDPRLLIGWIILTGMYISWRIYVARWHADGLMRFIQDVAKQPLVLNEEDRRKLEESERNHS